MARGPTSDTANRPTQRRPAALLFWQAMPPIAQRLLPLVVAALALAWFVVGIQWGLPSRRADPFLFGGREPWTGQRIVGLAGVATSPDRGADVDANPVVARNHPVVLNDTDAKRAEIVRRYRLYSYQPDEMITFNALRQMKPAAHEFDPRLYQYGGLWVYPVGAMLKIASALHLVDLRADVAFYLDHPEQFARFYVVARLYSALWGAAGAWAVYRLARHLSGARGYAPWIASVCFTTMPVVVNMAHEAKPHLSGAALMLLAVLAATNYVRTGGRKWWVLAGALCGAAFGMVLSSLPVFAVLPVMTLLRRQRWRDRVVVTLAAGLIGVDVYFLTNPYVLLHLVRRDPVLFSNLGNSTAMYRAGGSLDALWNAARLIAEGTSPLLAAAGFVGAVALGWRAWRVRRDPTPDALARRAAGLLLAAPALLVLAQFVVLAAGKPGEYGRFAILPDTFFAVEAVVAAVTFLPSRAHRRLALGAMALTTFIFGAAYVRHFLGDASVTPTRLRAAEALAKLPPGTAIGLENDPAPYNLPPVNLFDRDLVLMPRRGNDDRSTGVVEVRPVDVPDESSVPRADAIDRLFPARISWAGKHFASKSGNSSSDAPHHAGS